MRVLNRETNTSPTFPGYFIIDYAFWSRKYIALNLQLFIFNLSILLSFPFFKLTIYLVADLRALARKGKATVDIDALQTPVAVDTVLELIKNNTKKLIESGDYDDELEGRLVALENLNRHASGFLSSMIGKRTNLVEFVDNNGRTYM